MIDISSLISANLDDDNNSGNAAQDIKVETQHIHQQAKPAICPLCGNKIWITETGRSCCFNLLCDYEGTGIQQAVG